MVILHPAWVALVDQDPVILPAIKGCALVLGICREPWDLPGATGVTPQSCVQSCCAICSIRCSVSSD